MQSDACITEKAVVVLFQLVCDLSRSGRNGVRRHDVPGGCIQTTLFAALRAALRLWRNVRAR